MLITTGPHHFNTNTQSRREGTAAAQNLCFSSRAEDAATAQEFECAKLAQGRCAAAAQMLCCEADGYGG